jgi:hypothetical protein
MATLGAVQTRKALQACVAYYHLCTDYDDWGTLDTHWLQVNVESPAPGYLNAYFVRVRDTRRFKAQSDNGRLAHSQRGCLVVTFLKGEITQVEWYLKPRGPHKHPLENYKHRDDPTSMAETPKPECYGDWA